MKLGYGRIGLHDALDVLGLNPASRLRMGLDLARGIDLASAMSEENAERRAELLREAGIEEEE